MAEETAQDSLQPSRKRSVSPLEGPSQKRQEYLANEDQQHNDKSQQRVATMVPPSRSPRIAFEATFGKQSLTFHGPWNAWLHTQAVLPAITQSLRRNPKL